MNTPTLDECVVEYQCTGDSTRLIEQYNNFLNLYASMLWNETVDFDNYTVRSFLSCYIEDTETRLNLIRGKTSSTITKQLTHEALQSIRFKLRNHTWDDLFHEVVIPFLMCAKRYKQMGKNFQRYLFKAYKYMLKRHLDEIKLDTIDHKGIIYQSELQKFEEEEWEEQDHTALTIVFDSGLELNHPQWIHGEKSSEPFLQLKPHERFILSKYYYEEHTDKEIARMLPYNPKSIHRIRKRLKEKFYEMYFRGELKCLRL